MCKTIYQQISANAPILQGIKDVPEGISALGSEITVIP